MGISKPLDKRDIIILEELQMDGRMSLSALGRKIGLSQPAVSERVARLEADGVISGYRAEINLGLVDLKLSAVIRLSTTHEHIPKCLQRFAEMPSVIGVKRVTGEDCFVLEVVFSNPAELETVVDLIAQFGPVSTALVLRREKDKIIGRQLLSD